MHPLHNRNIPEKKFNSLTKYDDMRKYYDNGVVYEKPTSFLGRILAFRSIERKVDILADWYSFNRTCLATKFQWHKYSPFLFFIGLEIRNLLANWHLESQLDFG